MVDVDATGMNLYEFVQRYGAANYVDWACGCGDDGWRRWRRRVMGVPVIYDKKKGYNGTTCPESERERVEEAWPELVWFPENEFRKRFYK